MKTTQEFVDEIEETLAIVRGLDAKSQNVDRLIGTIASTHTRSGVDYCRTWKYASARRYLQGPRVVKSSLTYDTAWQVLGVERAVWTTPEQRRRSVELAARDDFYLS